MVNPLLAALAGGFLLFNSQASPRKAEKKFEDALRQAFPTAGIDVTIKGKRGFDVINGKFRSVRIEMRDFQIGPVAAPPTTAATPPVATGQSPAVAKAPAAPVSAPAQPLIQVITTAAPKDRGHIGRAEIALKNFGLGPLKIAAMDASFDEITYDWKELKNGRALAIEKSGPASATIVLPAASLETLMRERVQSFSNPRVTLQNGLVRITGTRAAPIIGTPLPVVFTAKPGVRGNEVRLEETNLSIAGTAVPAAVANSLIGEINPVFTFDRAGLWPYRVTLTSATAQNDTLTLASTLTFVPAKLAK
jgi:hypothetical protein